MARQPPRRAHRRGTRRPPGRRAHPAAHRPVRLTDPTSPGGTTSPRFRSLSHPNYRLYFAGSVVSNTGTWMQRVAQDWLVLSLPGNGGTELGVTTGLQFLPILLLSPYAGVVADRFPKRRLLQVTQATMALAALALGVTAAAGAAQTWLVYLLAFALGLGAAFDAPARQAFVSELVGPEDVQNAVGLNSASFNTARIIGPALAGVLIGAFGGGARATGWVILLNAVSFLAVIVQLQRMDERGLIDPRRTARARGMLREGVGYLSRQPQLLMVLVMVFFVGTFGMNFQMTSALMATQAFGKGAGEYGLLGSAMAVGSLSGALLAAGRTRVRLRLIVGAALAFGLAEIVAGLMPGYVAFALWCPVLGLSAITLLNSANATMQIESAPAVRGRVMALYFTVLAGGTPIGSPVIGWIGAHFGPRWTLLVGGSLVLAGVGIALLVRRYAEARIGRSDEARAEGPIHAQNSRFEAGTGDLALVLSDD